MPPTAADRPTRSLDRARRDHAGATPRALPRSLPDDLLAQVRALDLRARRRVDDLFAGEYRSAFRGQGVEFAEVREYEPGDDVRSIDWNVTARAGKPFVKRFVEERKLTVVIALDVSGSLAFGTQGRGKARLAADTASLLALTATRSNDRVGLVLFGDAAGPRTLRPAVGRRQRLRILREIVAAEPTGRGPGLLDAARLIGATIKRHAVVVFVSDFLMPELAGPKEPAGPKELTTALRRLVHRHDVVAIRITDPAEARLPRLGLVAVRDPESGRAALLDAASRRTRDQLARLHAAQRTAVGNAITASGADLVDLSTDRPLIRDLHRYLRSRERRNAR